MFRLPEPGETTYEEKFRKWVEKRGEYCFKINPLGRVGWPDRIIFGKGRLIFFIEFKKPKVEPRKLQAHIHEKIRELGFHVYVCKSFEEAQTAYREERRLHAS